ncbi:MAG: AI-2E family transporter [Spirochaetales bacterium]|nr:AI-2E family transporter [Spirochaetales bacterium]
MEQLRTERYSKITSYSLAFGACILALFLMKSLSNEILPLVVAFFIFMFVNPFLSKCDQVRIPKVISVILAMIIVLACFFLFVYVFFIMVNTLMTKLPQYVSKVNALDVFLSDKLRSLFGVEEGQPFSLIAWMNIDWFGIITSFLTSVSSKFVNIIGDCMLVFLYLLFIILERSTIFPKIVIALPKEKGIKLAEMVGRMNKLISKYLFIKIIISGGTGVMFYLIAIVTGMDFPLVWGVLAFILNFIPTIGSILVTGIAIFMAMVQFMPNWNVVIVAGSMFIMTQMVLGNIIDPKLQGVQLNISPLIILVSLAIWGYIWGILGMFLAVPLTSVVQIVCASSENLKPIAILISTGKIQVEQYKKEKKSRKC